MAMGEQVYGYFIPTVNLMGVGAHKEIPNQVKTLGGSNVLIVTDAFLGRPGGMADDIKAMLEAEGIKVTVFAGAEPNPPILTCMTV